MDISSPNYGKVLFGIIILIILGLVHYFTNWFHVAPIYFNHYTYQLVPSCRNCDDARIVLSNDSIIDYKIRDDWTATVSEQADFVSFRPNDFMIFGLIELSMHVVPAESEQEILYFTQGVEAATDYWLRNVQDVTILEVNDNVSQFGRNAQEIIAHGTVSTGSGLAQSFEIYFIETGDSIVQITASASRGVFYGNLLEIDQLDMLVNSIEFE